MRNVIGVEEPDTRLVPKIPLHLVLVACPSLKTFYQGDIRHWHQLFDAACHVRPAMGISASAWEEAQRFMGPEQAVRSSLSPCWNASADIRSPGGYLRARDIQSCSWRVLLRANGHGVDRSAECGLTAVKFRFVYGPRVMT